MSQLDNFEKMLAKGQDNALVRYTLGSLFCKQQRYAEAVEHLRHAVSFNPQYAAAWKLLGKALLESGQRDAAQAAWEQGLVAAKKSGEQQIVREIQIFLKRLTATD